MSWGRAVVAVALLGGLVAGAPHPGLKKENRDQLLAKAVLLEGESENWEAAQLYHKLYRLTGELPFLKKSVELAIYGGRYPEAIRWAKEGKGKEFKKLLFKALVFSDRLKEAEQLKPVVGEEYFYHLIISHLGGLGRDQQLLEYARRHYLETHSEEGLKIYISALLKTNRLQQAVRVLNTHLLEYPSSQGAVEMLGRILKQLEARQQLFSLYRRYPTPEHLEEGAQYFWERFDWQGLEKWLKENPSLPKIWWARLYLLKEEWKKGLKLSQELNSSSPEVQFYRGYFSHQLTGHPSIERLVQLAEGWGEVYGYRALLPVLVQAHRWELGEQIAIDGLEKVEGDPFFLVYLGIIYSVEGRCEEAQEQLSRVLTTDPVLIRLSNWILKRCRNDIAKNSR